MTSVHLLLENPDGSETAIELDDREITIGRSADRDLVLDDTRVSRRHAMIRPSPDGTFQLADLGSANGTVVNGTRLTMPATLCDGDVVAIGSMTFRFVAPGTRTNDDALAAEPTSTAVEAPVPELSLIGTSAAMTDVFRMAEKAAQSPIAVLIQGETGTGKELFARAIHAASRRAPGPFVPVNCAALPESLMESELFGHRRGAFTGANTDRKGLFEAASGGTIFLDEIGEMPAPMQAKLLRVLQESAVTPIGENRPKPVDIRVVSATNRDLQTEIGDGAFRADLYYRLAALRIDLPPLRDRREDIPLLAERLIGGSAREHGRQPPRIEAEALEILGSYSWPGNVRQLQNELDRAVALVPPGVAVSAAHLSDEVRLGECPAASSFAETLDDPDITDSRPSPTTPGPAGDLREARAEFEAGHIRRALEDCGGNIAKAARTLGLSRNGLLKKIKELEISVPGRDPD